MYSTKASPEQIAELLHKGLAADFEALIKERLQKQADAIISELARDIAKKTSTQVHAYLAGPSPANPFENQVQVILKFNNEDTKYVASNTDR